MRLVPRPIVICALAVAVMVVVPGLASAQESSRKKTPPKRPDGAERVSGVIVKVEEVAKPAKEGQPATRAHRLTINTDVIWVDWVRDQATATPTASTKKAAAKGANSVANKGEPKAPDTMIVIEIGPETKIHQRYRSSTDEVTEGAATPAGAADADRDPADTSPKVETAKEAATKPKLLSVKDLRPGLYLDVAYRLRSAANLASNVIVLRPVGGSDTPYIEEIPKKRAR